VLSAAATVLARVPTCRHRRSARYAAHPTPDGTSSVGIAFALQCSVKAVLLTIKFAVLLLAPLPARSAGRGNEGSPRFAHFHHGFDHRRFGDRFFG